jgi:hypothetical protein
MKIALNHFQLPAIGVMALFMMTSSAAAQVVQLPSYRNFSYSGSAWVPDGGTAALGGAGYAAGSSLTRGYGPAASRAVGSSVGGTSITASVQIIDLKALDDAILSVNVPIDPNAPQVISADSPAAEGGRSFISSVDAPPAIGVNPIDATADAGKWQRALSGPGLSKPVHPSLVASDIRFYLRRGKEAEQANRILAARVYYKMAMEAMTPELRERYDRILVERQKAEEELRKKQNDVTGRRSF